MRPRVIGKFDETGEWSLPHSDWLLPAAGELTPAMIARVIAARIARFHTSDRIKARLAFLEAKEAALAKPRAVDRTRAALLLRLPPQHLDQGARRLKAIAGIGCHYMATWLSPESTQFFCQMGGEGVPWVGQAPFTGTKHVFANLGDGTYMHSGILAIRAAVAAKVNITYKILYNDAVAMTGGQPHDGTLSVPIIAAQLPPRASTTSSSSTTAPPRLRPGRPAARRADPPPRRARRGAARTAPGAGVTALIYDQTCAAEKRRRRKRGKFPDPATRVVINDLVCEGCGDCSNKSNCMSVASVETEFGRKRTIDQSSCNKDYSCVKGLLPELRHRRRWQAAQGQGRWRAGRCVRRTARASTAGHGRARAFSSPASAVPAW